MTSLDTARTVADAVLYEGYLLYPYRSTSRKNQARWQFGVLGPPAGVGEPAAMQAECLVEAGEDATVTVHLRFLQLQARMIEQADAASVTGFVPVEELVVGGSTWLSWEEASEHEVVLGPYPLTGLPRFAPVRVGGGEEVEVLRDGAGAVAGRVVRRRWPLEGAMSLGTVPAADGVLRLRVRVANTVSAPVRQPDEAIRSSFIGAHLLVVAAGTDFLSLLDPPSAAKAAAAACTQHRCYPVLAGDPGERRILLVSPIILYDHPQVAEQSQGALYDSTEIDEILTLRVMTLTSEEKAAARATDPRAAAIIDRCDAMSPEQLQAMHGVLRDPHLRPDDVSPGDPMPADLSDVVPTFGDVSSPGGGLPWWDPSVDAAVSPSVDSVTVAGIPVAKDSVVRLHPGRRADAQDLFFVDQVARVTGVFFDVDGEVHIAVVLVNDPAADLHDWYGRYLYFSPDEIEPLPGPLEDSVP